MVKLKFTRVWRGYAKGQTADVPGGLAQQLLAQRVAIADNQQPLIETAAVEHATETADATPKRRGRRAAVPESQPPDRPGR
jgi:hypothetical protein